MQFSFEQRQRFEAYDRCVKILNLRCDLGVDRIEVNGKAVPYYHDSYSVGDEVCNDILNAIANIESTYGVHVYCIICNRYIDLGLLCTLLTVSSDESEWEMEQEDLKAMKPIAYVANLTYPEFSEWGTVVLKTHDGVVERIG